MRLGPEADTVLCMINIETLSDHAHRITVMAEFRQEDAQRLFDFARERNEAGGGGHALIDLTAASDLTFSAVAIELAHLPTLLKWAYGLERIAIVSDDDWVRTAARLESALLPGISYAVYDEDEAEAALSWVTEETDSAHHGAFRELDIGKPEIAAYELAGRLDREESERGIAMVRERFADGECSRMMMVIRKWHGFDLDQIVSREIISGKLEIARKLDRYAIVGGPGWIGRVAEAMSGITGTEIKAFDLDEQDAAIQWLAN